MGCLLFVFLLITTAEAQQPVTGKRVALVIGNNRYAGSPLENCVSDAAAIAKVLREQLKFDVVLADKDSENLDRLSFARRLQAFQKEASGAAVALFYYAGHGMEDFDGRDNYLIPVDANLVEAAKDNAGLQAQGIALEQVLRAMKEATKGAKIILLDCCRERPADRAIRTRDGGGFVMPQDADLPQDTLIMLAAAPARTASDGESGHGPFTAALIKHLPTAGTALFQTFRTVRNEVLTATNQAQRPWLKLDGAGDFFYEHALVVASAGASQSALPPAMPVLPTPRAAAELLRTASKDAPFVNSLGMRFVPVLGYKDGRKLLFSIWETRSKDYAAFVKATGHDAGEDWKTDAFLTVPVGRGEGESAEESSHPVADVSYEDAAAFCDWLTKRDREAGLIGAQDEYRLPTDVEWSHAVGIGEKEDASASPKDKHGELTDTYPWGVRYPPPTGSGNYADTASKVKRIDINGSIEGYSDGYATTSPVGRFEPNGLGIYDLGGNLWEWTSSVWEQNGNHVLRGASWKDSSSIRLISSCRLSIHPGFRSGFYGFRLVLATGAGD
ncbi:caspase family protein [Prosthecobacter sp.]|uniref:caspase family protein n=1 Tax=Prosthecobacter sp. TaxID=1965333 RepID=UPI003783DE8F